MNFSIRIGILLSVCATCLLAACGPQQKKEEEINWTLEDWESVKNSARGSTVNFMMWQGSPIVNDYINNFLRPRLKEKYEITLEISAGQGPQIVQLLMSEKQASVNNGQIDMVWINGETFFQLKKIKGLFGPFVQSLPNAKYIDFSNPFINTDFQQPIENMEVPWGLTQFAFMVDSLQVKNPPKDLKELSSFVKEKPGTFTISNDFSGMTVLKSFLSELGGSPESLNGEFDQQLYDSLSIKLWSWINEHKKYFWKQGSTFPKEHSRLDQMFASGEILLSYGFNEGSIEEKVRQGLFPKTTKGYAWRNGSIRNSNYLGITYNSSNKAGALVVINYLISPEAQLERLNPNGMNANTVLDISKLPNNWQKKFAAVPKRKYGPTLQELKANAIQEPSPEYMLNLYDDFRTNVIEK